MYFQVLLFLICLNCRSVMGKKSDEIPRGTSKTSPDTKICGLPTMPKPTLENCTEPLKEGIPDHRGNWTNLLTGTSQLIEQCGDRYVVSGLGNNSYYIHDFLHADGTLPNGLADYNALNFPECFPITAVGKFDKNCMNMTVGPIIGATRCLNSNGTLEFYNAQLGMQLLSKNQAIPTAKNSKNNIKGFSFIFVLLGMFFVLIA